ncbi:MAG: GTP-binding protein [Candidatus Heimdallarchaeota archaeon]
MKTFIYKITVIGDGMVGKTSLCRRYMGESFSGDYLATIGAQVHVKKVDVGGKKFKFQIWDIAGQPSWEALRKPYYYGAAGTVVVSDISRFESFENAPKWIAKQWSDGGKMIPTIVIGNKMDLRESIPAAIAPDQGKLLAKELSAKSKPAGFDVSYLETSAKTGENVQQAFALLARNIMAHLEMNSASNAENTSFETE